MTLERLFTMGMEKADRCKADECMDDGRCLHENEDEDEDEDG